MKKHPGRPLKTHAPGTEAMVGVLMPAEMKTRLQEQAGQSNRTLSAEAQLRLQESFRTTGRVGLLPDALHLAFNELGSLTLLLTVAMERSGKKAAWDATQDLSVWESNAWMDYPFAYDAAVKAAHDVLELARPPGAVRPYERPFSIAKMVTSYLKGTTKPPPAYSLEIRQLLSPGLLKRMLANAKIALGVTA